MPDLNLTDKWCQGSAITSVHNNMMLQGCTFDGNINGDWVSARCSTASQHVPLAALTWSLPCAPWPYLLLRGSS